MQLPKDYLDVPPHKVQAPMDYLVIPLARQRAEGFLYHYASGVDKSLMSRSSDVCYVQINVMHLFMYISSYVTIRGRSIISKRHPPIRASNIYLAVRKELTLAKPHTGFRV